jgi:hypothetical protein
MPAVGGKLRRFRSVVVILPPGVPMCLTLKHDWDFDDAGDFFVG